MKRKFLVTLIATLLLLAVFAGAALALDSSDTNLDGYNDNDFNKIQAFLNLTSAEPSKLNGEQINTSYDAANPATWTGVTWSSATPKRVEKIEWPETYLKGSLDVSNFSSLTKLECTYGEVSSVNLSGDTELTYLDISGNELQTLDVSSNTALVELYCGENYLTALDVSNHANLEALFCEMNELTSLNFSNCTNLVALVCAYNQLSGTLDLSAYPNLEFVLYSDNMITSLATGTKLYSLLSGYPNPVTWITSNIFTPNQNFSANGNGYIEFEASSLLNMALLYAEGHSNSVFVNWTINGEVLSTSPIHFMDPTDPETGDIIANFAPGITSSPADNVIYEGAKLILRPLFEGGTWQYDKACFEADFSDPGNVVFTAKKSGKTTIYYTLPGYEYEETPEIETGSLQTDSSSYGPKAKIESYINEEVTALDDEEPYEEIFDPIILSVDVTIKHTLLPQTGQSFTAPIVLAALGIISLGALLAIGIKKRKNA